VSANLTILDTHGDFGGTALRTTGQVAGFVPRTANVSVSWRHRGFNVRVNANRTGEYLSSFTAVGSGRNEYTRERTIVNTSFGYQYRPSLSFSIDVANLFNEPQAFYRGSADQVSLVRIPGTTVTFGVSGRF